MTAPVLLVGWGAPPLATQLAPMVAAGNLSEEMVAHYQRDSDAITRLSVRGIITRPQRDAAFTRLHRLISKDMKP